MTGSRTVLRIRDPELFWPLDPGFWSGIGKNPDNFSESLETVSGLKILKFFYVDPDPGSGIFLTLDSGSGMEKFWSGIQKKHPRSATLGSEDIIQFFWLKLIVVGLTKKLDWVFNSESGFFDELLYLPFTPRLRWKNIGETMLIRYFFTITLYF